MLSFGVTFMTDPPATEIVSRTVLAEENGFSHVWAWDSHVLWQDPYPVFTLMAAATSNIHTPKSDSIVVGHVTVNVTQPAGTNPNCP